LFQLRFGKRKALAVALQRNLIGRVLKRAFRHPTQRQIEGVKTEIEVGIEAVGGFFTQGLGHALTDTLKQQAAE